MPEPPQRELFPPTSVPQDAIAINARCLVRTQDGHRVVLVAGMPTAHYAVGDAMAEAHAMVSLSRGVLSDSGALIPLTEVFAIEYTIPIWTAKHSSAPRTSSHFLR